MAMTLFCTGILQERPDKQFQFLVRWFINDDVNGKKVTHLPHPEGKFKLFIRTVKSKQYIKADGSVAPIPTGTRMLPVVTPMNFMMIQPPLNGKIPIEPIDPKDKGEKGIGIYHILAETKESRYARKIAIAMETLIKTESGISSKEIFTGISIEEYSKAFARYVVRKRIKPRDLQAIFIKEFSALERLTFTASESGSYIPEFFTWHNTHQTEEHSSRGKAHGDYEGAWENALVMNDVFKNVEFLKAINEEVEKAENLKAQFAMLGLQGLEIIDYWCNPNVSQPNRVEADCGKKYSANEAVGLGVTVGNIDQATIKQWFDDGDAILIGVEYETPATASLFQSEIYDWKDLHDEELLADIPALSSADTIITNKGTNSIENALIKKNSCPPDVPSSASVDYDLFLKRLKPDFGKKEINDKLGLTDHLNSPTGDGRVQFKIIKPAEKKFPQHVKPDGTVDKEGYSSIISGANIYAVWEPESTASPLKQYFDDPTLTPSLAELKPWLITRRYSYNNELKPYFDSHNQNIKNNQSMPPQSPAFQNPGQVTDLEKINRIKDNNEVINELMPRRNKEEIDKNTVVFAFNIREGFKNPLGSDPITTWDKFPLTATASDWRPSLWRNNTDGSRPQGYRFWATSVDIFGQESLPISVQAVEVSGTAPETIFHFKNRLSLQPPPSNNDQQKEAITITFDGRKLQVKWESPFQNSLGNASAAEGGAAINTRLKKDVLVSNLLYLRKPHTGEGTDIPDKDLEAHIVQMLATLPASFNNDKWKIGLREVLFHNSNWRIHRYFDNITNSDPNDIWQSDLAISDADKGFDYIALINYSIKNDKRQFWIQDDYKRKLYVAEQTADSKYSYGANEIQELPATSNVIATESKLIANPFVPRPVKILSKTFLPSKPVLGIQGINRDLVLSNILTTPNTLEEVDVLSDGQSKKQQAVVFSSTTSGLLYTAGQEKMMDAVLARSNVTSGLNLEVVRKILSEELTNLNKKIFSETIATNGKTYFIFDKDKSKNVVANDLIGFRGLKQLKLRYDSIFSNAAGPAEESEAIKYHVFQSKIPLNENMNFNASFVAKTFTAQSELVYTGITFEKNVLPDTYNVPIAVTVKYAQGFFVAQLKSVKKSTGDSYNIELYTPFIKEVKGSPVALFFSIATKVYEKEIALTEKNYIEEDLVLPVGGGFRELFIWSVQTSSALDKLSASVVVDFNVFQTSILPPTPIGFSASPITTMAEKENYILDSTQHRHWIPSQLHNATKLDMQRQPRLSLSWTKDTNLPSDIFLAIERDFREEEDPGISILADIKNEWDLASKIEKTEFADSHPAGTLNINWLSKSEKPSLYRWLFESSPVEVPGEMAILNTERLQLVGPLSLMFDPSSQLEMLEGLKVVSTGKAMFIDYFYDNSDRAHVMDTFRSYNYRLASYIDIDPDGSAGIKDPRQKYLYSKPSEWTGWVRPAFPEITDLAIISYNNIERPKDQLFPELKLTFVLNELAAERLRAEAKNLLYRIIVKKQVKNSINTFDDAPGRVGYIEVGDMLEIPVLPEAGSGINYVIDKNLERENYNAEISPVYRVEISVIARDAQQRMYILRKEFIKVFETNADKDKLKIPALQDNDEIRKTVILKIN